MVGAFGEVQVMDWGLAKVLTQAAGGERATGDETTADGAIDVGRTGDPSAETEAGSAMGTYAYMPPEQAAGVVAAVNRRSDVFSLGAVLCTILTGKPPYTN